VLASYAARVGERDARVPTGFVFTDDPAGQTAWKPNRVTKSFSVPAELPGCGPHPVLGLQWTIGGG
jgi:hypothetical protein